MAQGTFGDIDAEYQEFVDKFKPKKTTDDCYTPGIVYDALVDWVADEYGVDRADMVRPFWPGGDYERFDYHDGCCVVDNPPFSIVTKIRRFYQSHGIRYFLFALALTLISSFDSRETVCFIACGADITYENGANVKTSFVTNLDPEYVLRTAPDLKKAVEAADRENTKAKKVELPKYVYPYDVLTAARAQWMAQHNTDYRVRRGECVRITKLDEDVSGKGIFGGGLLLSERAAAERAAARKWQLSERERKIQKLLGGER